MPVKILLADKSITIQKVVEMLFSGKEFEVTCVSDGETAVNEAARIVPGVVLADVDLPRMDGYSFASQLRATPALASVPVILMLSRDDQYDAARGRQAGIVDNIAKPFESQELIGKVKKALSGAPAAAAAPAPSKPAVAPPPPAPPKPAAAPAAQPAAPKKTVPSDIFDILQEAPASAAQPPAAAPAAPAEADAFEVEPEIEVEPEHETAAAPVPPPPQPQAAEDMEIEAEIVPDDAETEQIFGKARQAAPAPAPATFDFSEPLPSDVGTALPVGAKAMEEIRAGLGLGGQPAEEPAGHPDFVNFESLDMASRASHAEFAPPVSAAPVSVSPRPPAPAPPSPAPVRTSAAVSDEMVRAACQEAVDRMAREIIERVAWEVVPELAERMIRDEIERLKSGA